MPQKIHMHDQVSNKVEAIMTHYKRRPMSSLMQFFSQWVKQTSIQRALPCSPVDGQTFNLGLKIEL